MLGCAMLLFAVQHSQLWMAFVAMGVAGVGSGCSFGAMPGLIITSVPRTESGKAMGLYQVLRSAGFASGSALCAAVLAAFTSAGEAAPRIGGYQAVLTLGAVLCLGSALLALLLPGRHEKPLAPDPDVIAASEAEATTVT
jgi:MFS family permease